jgi:hypothetical protein
VRTGPAASNTRTISDAIIIVFNMPNLLAVDSCY